MFNTTEYKEIFGTWFIHWNGDNSYCPMCKKEIKKDCMRGHLRNRQCSEFIKKKWNYKDWDTLFELWKCCNPRTRRSSSEIHDITPEEQAVCDIQEVCGYRYTSGNKIEYQVRSKSNYQLVWISGATMTKSRIGRNLKSKYLRMRQKKIIPLIQVS